MDHHAAVFGPFRVVALVPHAGDPLEIGGPVAGVARIGVEAEGHRGERGPAHELTPDSGRKAPARLVDDVDVHAEAGPLDLARVDRARGVARDQAPAEVGAPRDGGEVDVGLHRVVHDVEPFWHQRRSGRGDGPDGREVVAVDGAEAGLAQRLDELRRGAEQRDPRVVGQVEQPVAVGVERRAVVEDQGGAGGEARRQPVPHHPAGRREVEDPVAGPDVAVELMFDEVLQQHASGPVHDALRDARGARGEQHVPGVVEGERGELGLAGFAAGEERVEHHRVGDGAGRSAAAEGHDHHLLDTGKRGPDLGERPDAVVDPPAVLVAVAGEEEPGLDLTEPVDHPVDAEVGRGRGEDGTDRRGREHDRVGLDDVGEPRRDPVARLDPGPAHGLLQLPHHRAELVPGNGAAHGGVLPPEDQRGLGAREPQQVLRDVEGGVRQEPGPPHLVGGLEGAGPPITDHPQVVPRRGPEPAGVGHRPCVQRRIVVVARRRGELGQPAAGRPGRRRRPHRSGRGVHENGAPGSILPAVKAPSTVRSIPET